MFRMPVSEFSGLSSFHMYTNLLPSVNMLLSIILTPSYNNQMPNRRHVYHFSVQYCSFAFFHFLRPFSPRMWQCHMSQMCQLLENAFCITTSKSYFTSLKSFRRFSHFWRLFSYSSFQEQEITSVES